VVRATDRHPNGPRPAARRGSGARASSGPRGRARPRPKGRGAPKLRADYPGSSERVCLAPRIPLCAWRCRLAALCQLQTHAVQQTRCTHDGRCNRAQADCTNLPHEVVKSRGRALALATCDRVGTRSPLSPRPIAQATAGCQIANREPQPRVERHPMDDRRRDQPFEPLELAENQCPVRPRAGEAETYFFWDLIWAIYPRTSEAGSV
jgi:hypothetical protein